MTSDHQCFADMVTHTRATAPQLMPHVIAGERRYVGDLVAREDPSRPDLVVSQFHSASPELVQEAVFASRKAQLLWNRVPLLERVEHVARGHHWLSDRVEEVAVRIAVETGKTRTASRSEVVEVLEFLRLFPTYASAPGAFEEDYPGPGDGLASQTVLRPYGVFGVITPFNYPFALAAGPIIGALLAGNGAVLKTSDRGPWSGQAVFELTEAMQLPTGLVNVIHGRADAGSALVDSEVDGIAFTGSAEVGNSIIRKLAGGPYPKPVIAEMGGKNPTIVTSGADLDAAAEGIVFSAFDLTGQKCSALSRVLATPDVAEELTRLVNARSSELVFADPVVEAAYGGPLVSKAAQDRYSHMIAALRTSDFDVHGHLHATGPGYFATPVVVSGVPEAHPFARDEHFLPVVSVSAVEDFHQGLAAANAVPYGLAAGLYTASTQEAQTFLYEMQAGCINVNVRGHATTGWWPGRSTFGGWKGSGSTGKQGYGKSYVQQFARQQSQKAPELFADLLVK